MNLVYIFLTLIGLFYTEAKTNPEEEAGLFEGDIAGIIWDEYKGAYQIPNLSRQLWASGIVPYTFDSMAAFTNQEKQVIISGMKLVEDKTRVNGRNCITFVSRTNQPTYVRIIRGKGCYSNVGKQVFSGPQDLSLGNGCVDTIITAHEFIHALGWLHEQSRPDRDDYVVIYQSNIQKGAEKNFAKMSDSQAGQLYYPYDYDSIMHYPTTAFSSNGQPTILPKKEGAIIGQRSHISEIDIQEIRDAYKCK